MLFLTVCATSAQTVLDSLLSLKGNIEKKISFDEVKYTETVNELIYRLMDAGDFYTAQKICQDGLRFLYEHGSGENTLFLRNMLRYSALIDVYLKNYIQAADKIWNVIKMCEDADEKNDINYFMAYQDLAQILFKVRDYVNMKKYMDISVAIYEQHFGSIFQTKVPQMLMFINNYGLANYLNKDLKTAEKCFKYVIDNCDDTHEFRNALSIAQINYASILIKQHKYNDAEQLMLNTNVYDPEQIRMYWLNWITNELILDKSNAVIGGLSMYNNNNAQVASMVLTDFPKDERENYWNDISYEMLLLNNFVAAGYPNSQAPELAYNNTLFCRNILINTDKIIAKYVKKSNNIDLITLYDSLQHWQYKYTFQTSNKNEADSLKVLIRYAEDLVNHNIYHLDSVLLKNTRIWTDVKNSLTSGEYAIEFSYTYLPHLDNNGKILEINKDTLYCALITGHNFDHPNITLSISANFFDSIVFPPNTDVNWYNLTYTQSSTLLYRILFKSIESFIPDAHTIYYSPCGNLSQLNFDLFTDENGTPLNRKYKMVRVSSTANIPEIKSLDPKSFKTSALYGGIDYKNAADNLDVAVRGVDFRNLPNTGAEIKNVAKILTAANIKTDTICGENATEESFKKLSGNSPDILHIATHGFYLDEDSQKPFAQSVNTYSQKESAMALSGLALSGANNAWKGNFDLPNVEDGILTAYEISQLDLSNTKLVVLSACETARGRIFPVDGVFGLQRAFKQAGAGSILMSLWKVDDNATATFMEYFYKFLFETNDRHKALKMAQDEVKKQFPDPYYWAAWVMLD